MSNNNKKQIKTPFYLITKPYNEKVTTATDKYRLKYQFQYNSSDRANRYWNNEIGRRVGRELQAELMGKRKLSPQTIDDMIAEKIMQKMRNGELITSPDDPRARTLIEKFKNNSKIPKNWQEYLNTPKDFSKLQSSKLDELKTPTVEGVGNNAALVDNSELLVKYPTPTVNTSTNWLSTLGHFFQASSLQIQE